MEPTTIRIHSITDLITNSSTVIYTYSDASAAACTAMIDEILQALGTGKKCSDIFSVELVPEDYAYMFDWAEDNENELLPKDFPSGYQEKRKFIEGLHGPARPDWLAALEKQFLQREDGNGYKPSSSLQITPLAPEFTKTAELVMKFLYSTDHEATRDG